MNANATTGERTGPPDEHVVRAATGLPDATPGRWWTEPVDHPVASWATAELSRVRGVTTTGAPWSAFVKVLRSSRGLPLPEPVRAMAAADLTWRHEADVYRAGLDDVLPAGLRFPRRYRIDEVDDDRIVEWLEDVAPARVEWDSARFGHVARLLGRLAVRLTGAGGRMPPSVTRVPGEVLRLQWTERELFWLPALADATTWGHPLVHAHADPALPADVARLAARVPAILDVLDGLPQTFVHGDASPQNLLVPAVAPDTVVAVDWSLVGPCAVGYDLGQLVVGLAHLGRSGGTLPDVTDAVLAAYTAGLADEGLRVDVDVVRFGFHAALVVRSAFSALPLSHLAGPPRPGDAARVAHRVALTRQLVDLGLALPEAGP